MPYQLLDDGFAEHPKVMDLSDRAFRLHVTALCYCSRNLTDGQITDKALSVLCAITRATRKHVSELVQGGLWDDGETREIHDYLKYHDSAAKIKEKREKRRAAGRIGGKRSGEARAKANEANASANGEANGWHDRSTPSHPIQERPSALRELIDESLRGAA